MRVFKIILSAIVITVSTLSFASLSTKNIGIINRYSESFSVFNETVEISINPLKNLDLIGNALDRAIKFEY